MAEAKASGGLKSSALPQDTTFQTKIDNKLFKIALYSAGLLYLIAFLMFYVFLQGEITRLITLVIAAVSWIIAAILGRKVSPRAGLICIVTGYSLSVGWAMLANGGVQAPAYLCIVLPAVIMVHVASRKMAFCYIAFLISMGLAALIAEMTGWLPAPPSDIPSTTFFILMSGMVISVSLVSMIPTEVMRDSLNEVKNKSGELDQARVRLEQAERLEALGRLAGGVAHDFNNMLLGISGAAELLEENLKEQDPENAQLVNMILEASDHAADLTNKLLLFGRKASFKKKPVNMNRLISSTSDLIRRTVTSDIEVELVLTDEPLLVNGDDTAMVHAFVNLAMNAKDAIHESGRKGRLSLSLSQVKPDELGNIYPQFFREECGCGAGDSDMTRCETLVKITVKDNGVGISEDLQQRIFEPFFTTKEIGHGTGLGLAAVMGTVEEHGGLIQVRSGEDEGTQFDIYLPRYVLENDETIPESPTIDLEEEALQVPRHLAVNFKNQNILVVDDEKLVLTMMSQHLALAGYQVLPFMDGESALREVGDIIDRQKDGDSSESPRIHAAIIDMVMPKMRGSELLVALKKLDPKLPIIIVSGFTDDQRFVENRYTRFLKKPFHHQQLLDTLNDLELVRTSETDLQSV